MNINDNKQKNIQFSHSFKKGLYLNGSWELVGDDFSPANTIRSNQKACVDILTLRDDSANSNMSGKLSFMLVGHSLENKTFQGQIGETATICLGSDCGKAVEYDLSIEIPPNTLPSGSYEVMLLTTYGAPDEAPEIAGVSEKTVVRVEN